MPLATPQVPDLGGFELLHGAGLDRFELCLGLHLPRTCLCFWPPQDIRQGWRAIKSAFWMGRRYCALSADLGDPSPLWLGL